MPDEPTPPPPPEPNPSAPPPASDPEIGNLRRQLQRLEKQVRDSHTQLEEQHNQSRSEREALLRRVLRAEVRAAATGKLQQVDDAERFIDLSGFKVNEQGEYDQAAILSAIDGLVRDRPYLMPKAQATPPPLPGNGPQEPAPQPAQDMNAIIRKTLGRS